MTTEIVRIPEQASFTPIEIEHYPFQNVVVHPGNSIFITVPHDTYQKSVDPGCFCIFDDPNKQALGMFQVTSETAHDLVRSDGAYLKRLPELMIKGDIVRLKETYDMVQFRMGIDETIQIRTSDSEGVFFIRMTPNGDFHP